jgi:hypothetical protein
VKKQKTFLGELKRRSEKQESSEEEQSEEEEASSSSEEEEKVEQKPTLVRKRRVMRKNAAPIEQARSHSPVEIQKQSEEEEDIDGGIALLSKSIHKFTSNTTRMLQMFG